jgi:hypothetical protein
MKKLVLALIMVMALSSTSFAGRMRVQDVTGTHDTSVISCSTSVPAYTRSFPIGSGEFFGLMYEASSASSTCELQIELEQSFTLPTTEGAEDAYWVEPATVSDIATASSVEGQWYATTFSPVPMPFARFKITNHKSGADDAAILMKVGIIEKN